MEEDAGFKGSRARAAESAAASFRRRIRRCGTDRFQIAFAGARPWLRPSLPGGSMHGIRAPNGIVRLCHRSVGLRNRTDHRAAEGAQFLRPRHLFDRRRTALCLRTRRSDGGWFDRRLSTRRSAMRASAISVPAVSGGTPCRRCLRRLLRLGIDANQPISTSDWLWDNHLCVV